MKNTLLFIGLSLVASNSFATEHKSSINNEITLSQEGRIRIWGAKESTQDVDSHQIVDQIMARAKSDDNKDVTVSMATGLVLTEEQKRQFLFEYGTLVVNLLSKSFANLAKIEAKEIETHEVTHFTSALLLGETVFK